MPSLIHPLESMSWKELLTAGISTPRDLPFALNHGHAGLEQVTGAFPMRINAYFLSLIQSAEDPLGRQVVPQTVELQDMDRSADPLAEEVQSPAPNVIHRYPHRVAFLVSNQCAVYCRFCMRKRRVGSSAQVPPASIELGLAYIRNQTRINEVVLTGGDPLMLDDDRLLAILSALRKIDHVHLIRIHTRIPCVLPQRISGELVRSLSKYHPLFINLHFNHPAEITAEAAAACGSLANAGIPLGSQTVLLKGINDDPVVLGALMASLLRLRVRPYYLHQLDRVPGTAHFQVPVDKSLELLEALRGPLSGMAIPHLMIDLPEGGGKVALTPAVVLHKGENQWRVRNWKGDIYTYPL